MKKQNHMKTIITLSLLFVSIFGYSQGKQTLWNEYIGEHKIKLQWLDNSASEKHPMGKVIIDQDYDLGILTIEGSQIKNGDEYVTIIGVIEPISSTEFIFTGTITTRVSYINNNEPCERIGVYTFKKTKGRKFWRMQEMMNCDGSSTDYIDIY